MLKLGLQFSLNLKSIIVDEATTKRPPDLMTSSTQLLQHGHPSESWAAKPGGMCVFISRASLIDSRKEHLLARLPAPTWQPRYQASAYGFLFHKASSQIGSHIRIGLGQTELAFWYGRLRLGKIRPPRPVHSAHSTSLRASLFPYHTLLPHLPHHSSFFLVPLFTW